MFSLTIQCNGTTEKLAPALFHCQNRIGPTDGFFDQGYRPFASSASNLHTSASHCSAPTAATIMTTRRQQRINKLT
jgi:hypothetical protein